MISRRSFLKAVSASVALTTASRRLLSWADEAVEVPGKEGLIVRSARFLDLEMPPEFFDSWITPVPHFFVRNHMHEPNTLGPSEWRLTIGGEVEKPQTLNLTDLAKIEPHTVTNTLDASCKGLTEIKVLDKEFEGNFMKPGYRMHNQPMQPGADVNPDDTHPITALNVKSIIAGPIDNSIVRSRSVHIHGAAWAGEADVARVEVSTDGGSTWQSAQLGREKSKYAWRLWNYSWHAPHSGDYTILSGAADSQGRTYPQTAAWNPSGYLYNAVDQVKIHVQA